jgi:hypothetical protein
MSTPVFDYYKALGLPKDASFEDGALPSFLSLLLMLNVSQCDGHTSRRYWKLIPTSFLPTQQRRRKKLLVSSSAEYAVNGYPYHL